MADQTTRLISASDFAAWFELSDYIEADKINPNILNAQVANLRPIIDNTTVSGGDTLYTRLLDYVEASKLPTDTDLDNLLLRITPYLVNQSLVYYLPLANIYPTNMGMRVLKEDNSDPLTPEGIAALSDKAKSLSNIYEKDLREYLCLNATTYLWSEGAASNFNTTPNIGKIGFKSIKRN